MLEDVAKTIGYVGMIGAGFVATGMFLEWYQHMPTEEKEKIRQKAGAFAEKFFRVAEQVVVVRAQKAPRNPG